MPSLFNQQISATYKGLLKTTSNGVLSSSLAQITDGNGNDSPLSMSTTEIQFNTGSNTFKFPTTRGTIGQILKLADVNGTLDWVADASGDVTKTGTIALNTIAVWNDSVDELRSDTTMSINTNHTISLSQTNSNDDDVSSYNIGGGNIANVTGSNNVGFGSTNLANVSTGNNNVAIGNYTCNDLTTGGSNTAVGINALNDLTEGDYNTAIGAESLSDVSTGDNNTAIGKDSGAKITTGSGNILLGVASGDEITTGSNNVIIGTNAGSATLTNNIIISDGSGNNRIQVDSGGNMGIGVTPENSTGTWRNLQFGGGNIVFRSSGNNGVFFGTNYLFKTDNSEVYKDAAATSRIYFDGDVIKIQQSGSGTANLPITWIDPLTISSGGNVGIGTTSPTQSKLVISPSVAAAALDGLTLSYHPDATAAQVRAKLFIDSYHGKFELTSGSGVVTTHISAGGTDTYFNGGNVGIGTTSPSAGAVGGKVLHLVNSGASASMRVERSSATIAGTLSITSGNTTNGLYSTGAKPLVLYTNSTPQLTISSGGAATFGGSVTASGGYYYGQTTDSFVRLDNTIGSQIGYNNYAYSLYDSNGVSFYTATNATPTLRMRISSGGSVAMAMQNFASNPSSTNYGVKLQSGTIGKTYWQSSVNATTSHYHYEFINPSGTCGYITTVGTTTTNYTSVSDYRLKENVTPITDALSRVNQLKPSRFNFIADADKTIIDGFIAHEVQDVIPLAISGEKDATKEDGTPDYQGIDQSKIVPLLTAAIQEQQTIIEDLKARIETLEG